MRKPQRRSNPNLAHSLHFPHCPNAKQQTDIELPAGGPCSRFQHARRCCFRRATMHTAGRLRETQLSACLRQQNHNRQEPQQATTPLALGMGAALPGGPLAAFRHFLPKISSVCESGHARHKKQSRFVRFRIARTAIQCKSPTLALERKQREHMNENFGRKAAKSFI